MSSAGCELHSSNTHHVIIQLSAGLLLERAYSLQTTREPETPPTASDICARREQLTSWFAPWDANHLDYKLRPLYEELDVKGQDPIVDTTSVGQLSRHGAYDVDYYKGYGTNGNPGGADVPQLFRRPPECNLRSHHWGDGSGVDYPLARISAQKPHTGRGSQNSSPSVSIKDLDHNDFLVTGATVSDALLEARRFVAFLFALRRARYFAASLAERMYTIWLPPSLLEPDATSCENRVLGCKPGHLAMFPFLMLTRRSNSKAWRFTSTFNTIIVPAEPGAILAYRDAPSEEIGAIVSTLDGPSTNQLGAIWRQRYNSQGRALPNYLEFLFETTPAANLSADVGGPKPLRNWLELLLLATARRQQFLFDRHGTVTRGTKKPSMTASQLADEVLRSLRSSSCWSVTVTDPDFATCSRDSPPRDGEVCASSAMCDRLKSLFSCLAPANEALYYPSVDDRVDAGRTDEVDSATWVMPWRRCIVFAESAESETFPSRSRLHGLAFFTYIVSDLMTAREIMGKLGRDAELQRKELQRVRRHRLLVIELEEMYDLNITWIVYARLYQRARALIGLEDMYRGVQERAKVLGEYNDKFDRLKYDSQLRTVNVLAALFALTIVVLTVVTVIELLSSSKTYYALLVSCTAAFGGLIIVSALAFWAWRRIRDWR